MIFVTSSPISTMQKKKNPNKQKGSGEPQKEAKQTKKEKNPKTNFLAIKI